MEFEDLSEFKKWKEVMECETKAFYTLSVIHKSKLHRIYRYDCHRSGTFASKAGIERRRALKIKGSRKTGKACPARIIVTENNCGGTISAEFFETHVGHDQDVGHLSLTVSTRQTLASELLQGVSKRKFIEKIASTFSPTKRLSYTTKKDLHNISATFNLKGDVKFHADD